MSTTIDPFEARVVARLDQEKSELGTRIAELESARESALAGVSTARDASQRLLDKVYNAIDGEKTVSTDVEAKALAGVGDHRKSVHEYVAAHRALLDARALRKTLDTKAERDRRVKQARDYDPETSEPLTQRAAVELVLMRSGRPMHYREITRIGLQTGLIRTDGETPEATVSAMLAVRAKRGDTFMKVEPGIFALLPVEAEAVPEATA